MPLQEVCTTGTVLGNGEVHVASRFNDHIESSPTPLSRANVLTAAASSRVNTSPGRSF